MNTLVLNQWNKNIMLIAGVDEVGRGPLAGAVVTAAVILRDPIEGLADSKKLTAKKENYYPYK